MIFEIKWKWFKKLFYNTKLYEKYIQVKDIFKEPIMYCYVGPWKKDRNLPVWRRGKDIFIGKWENRCYVAPREYDWTNEYKRRHPIFTKIVRPYYRIPYYLSCYWFNHGLVWKLKFDEYRFEYPPAMTLVLFGFSISIWLTPPNKHSDYDYWESILWYIELKDIKLVKEQMGSWKTYQNGEYVTAREACSDDFLILKNN